MSRFKVLPHGAGALVIVLGALTLTGWAFDIHTLKSVFPGLITMKANTALCFILAAVALLLQANPEPVPAAQRVVARSLAGLVLFAAGCTLLEHVTGRSLGLDQVLFRESLQEAGDSFPGRMSPASSLSFAVLATALLTLDMRSRRFQGWPALWLTLAVVVITLLAFIGYFYRVENLHWIAPYTTIALHSVIAFWLLCLGILFARPERGLMAMFTSDSPGGLLARRMLPAAILLPLFCGWLSVAGERARLFDLGFGSALFATALITIFTALVTRSAATLNRVEADRRRDAEALRHTHARLDGIITSALDAVISFNADRRIVLFNPAAEKMFGVRAAQALGQPVEQFLPEAFLTDPPGRRPLLGAGTGEPTAALARRASGEQFPVEASTSQVEVDKARLFTVILRDITERRRTEESLFESERREHARRVELETLMEGAPVVVFIAHDAECRLITGNRAAQEMLRMSGPVLNFSRTAPESQRPVHFKVHKHGRLVPDELLPMQAAGREGKPVLGQELEVRFADGTARWIYGNAVPLLKPDGTVRGVVAAFVDITALQQAEQELKSSRENLRRLAGRLQAVREEERTMVAREIHDVLAQELTSLKMDLAWLNRRLAQPIDEAKQHLLREKVAGMSTTADTAIASVQRIATELRPVVLDSLGLCAAIEWQAKDFEQRSGIACRTNMPDHDLHLDRDSATALFRILQESLTNVARHSGATQVDIELHRDDGWVNLAVRDNGRGIRAAEVNDPYSVGLLGMRERATLLGGQCEIGGHPGAGTAVTARLPFRPEPQPHDESL